MKFFIDTAKVEDIKKANDMGVICGVTTNPSPIAKEEEYLKKLLQRLHLSLMDQSAVRLRLQLLMLRERSRKEEQSQRFIRTW